MSLSIWNLPGPGIKPMSRELAGRFLSTGPLGKSKVCFIVLLYYMACGTLVPPLGIEPMLPALEGGVLTTGPLEKSLP